MAHDEACQLYIKQEIERGLEEGKTPYSIGKELSAWVAKLFEVNIPANTLRVKADRVKQQLCTNVHSDTTSENNLKKEDKRLNDKYSGKFVEGNPGGPGRPPKYEVKQRYSCAEQMVSLAIDHLGRIPADDPMRSWAKEEMLYWIENNL